MLFLALAAAVAVGSVTGVAAVKSPTSSLVPVNARECLLYQTEIQLIQRLTGTAEAGVVSAKKSTATVPTR